MSYDSLWEHIASFDDVEQAIEAMHLHLNTAFVNLREARVNSGGTATCRLECGSCTPQTCSLKYRLKKMDGSINLAYKGRHGTARERRKGVGYFVLKAFLGCLNEGPVNANHITDKLKNMPDLIGNEHVTLVRIQQLLNRVSEKQVGLRGHSLICAMMRWGKVEETLRLHPFPEVSEDHTLYPDLTSNQIVYNTSPEKEDNFTPYANALQACHQRLYGDSNPKPAPFESKKTEEVVDETFLKDCKKRCLLENLLLQPPSLKRFHVPEFPVPATTSTSSSTTEGTVPNYFVGGVSTVSRRDTPNRGVSVAPIPRKPAIMNTVGAIHNPALPSFDPAFQFVPQQQQQQHQQQQPQQQQVIQRQHHHHHHHQQQQQQFSQNGIIITQNHSVLDAPATQFSLGPPLIATNQVEPKNDVTMDLLPLPSTNNNVQNKNNSTNNQVSNNGLGSSGVRIVTTKDVPSTPGFARSNVVHVQ
eukprot:TRINITY_DN477_c0_g1_i1.p1 TRINITY_DN477_c0_g1~~TRINITY_DN477_c0_g1_i1.p1  ORF type:complete len:472 (+),score=153.91 TRINITY_DN477_c0_g1_i1:109-1524(+)